MTTGVDCTQFKLILSIFFYLHCIYLCTHYSNNGWQICKHQQLRESTVLVVKYTTTQVRRTSSKSYESPLWNQQWSILVEWRLKIPGFAEGCSCDPIGYGRWVGKHLQSQRNRTPYQCRYVVGPLLHQTNRVQVNYTQDLIINRIWFIAYMIDYCNFLKIPGQIFLCIKFLC